MRPTSQEDAVRMANKAADKLVGYCSGAGFPSCYKTFEDSLSDFYPDLPWDTEGMQIALQYIIDNRTPMIEEVKSKFGYDLMAEFQRVLAEVRDLNE